MSGLILLTEQSSVTTGGIIMALIALVSGGALLKIIEAVNKSGRAKRIARRKEARAAHEERVEPEIAFRENLLKQQDDMRKDILFLRSRMEELIEENATIKAENATLIRQNEELIVQNRELLARLGDAGKE